MAQTAGAQTTPHPIRDVHVYTADDSIIPPAVILCIVEAIEISFVCSGDWRSDYRSNLGGDPINTN